MMRLLVVLPSFALAGAAIYAAMHYAQIALEKMP